MEEIKFEGVARKTAESIVALISRSFFLNLFSFGSFLLVSVQLQPSDLGIYTSVIAIQRLISFFTDFGLGAALVQKKDELTEEDIRTTFTIQFIITLAIFLIVLLFLSPIVSYFKLTSQGSSLLVVLVFTVFLSSFKMIPSILLERKIAFGKIIIPQIVESLTFNLVLIILVLNKFGIDSFTWAFLVSGLVGIPVYLYISPWIPKFGIHKKSFSHLRYGTQFQLKNILATLKDDLLTVFLVKVLSFNQIGYIGFGQKIAFFMYRYIVDSVTKVTFSTYSRIQETKEYLAKAIEKSLFFVSLVMFPVLLGIIILIPYVINIVPKWSNKWEPAIISLVFFCLNALVSSLSGILVNVLDATGRVKTTLRLMVLWTLLTWIFTLVGIYLFGYQGVAAASFLVTLTIFYTAHLVKKVIPFNFIRSIYKPTIASLIMAFFTFTSSLVLVKDYFSLSFVILLSGILYVVIVFILAKKEIVEGVRLFIK